MKIAVFAGSFDPITLGHIEIVERGTALFDKVIVGVGVNSSKQTLFTAAQRLAWVEGCFKGHAGVEVHPYDILTVDFARQHNATFLLRGLRNYADLEYETHISRINRHLNADMETVFLVCSAQRSHISSSFVREIHRYKGSLDGLVPEEIASELRD
jgi:pantetheine-phosphate adenylyltransferase